MGDPFPRYVAAVQASPVFLGDDALAAEGRATVKGIAEALPDAEMRRRLESVAPLRVFAQRT